MKKETVQKKEVIPLREVKIDEIWCCPRCGVLFNKEIRTWESYWEGETAFCPICSKVNAKDEKVDKVEVKNKKTEGDQSEKEKESGWF
jgi:hypothetical protein